MTMDASSAPRSRAAPIIERAPLPIVEVQGATHVVLFVNPAFCVLLGKTKDELIGKTFAEIVPGGDECVPLLNQVYETGEAVTHARVKAAQPDDDAAWLYAMWPALDDAERPAGVVIQMTKSASFRRDVTEVNEALLVAGLRQHELTEAAHKLNVQLHEEVTERGRAEEALREALQKLAQADRNKDDFLAMLAHELRNPLAPIKMAAHLLGLAKGDSASALVSRAREIIERQADHLAKLVDELLDVSRIQMGKIRLRKEHIDLVKAVMGAVDSCEHIIRSHDHKLTLDMQHTPPVHIDADGTRIDQIIVNLVTNAAKYTPLQGLVHIKVANEGGVAVVRVRDNGVGLAPDMLLRVFDVFTQVEQSIERSEGGLGLGLKLVRELTELHGGTVEACSEGLGKGTEFIVRLPALDVPDEELMAIEEVTPVHVLARRILVVDDSPDIREAMEMLLSMLGHTVLLAENGEEAVQKALQGHPDVAFVDIGLPKLSGYDVAREIRKQPGGGTIVLIALSGYGQAEDKRKALDAGFDAHLTKPVSPDVLTEILNELERFHRWPAVPPATIL